jgi:hypothetical protein
MAEMHECFSPNQADVAAKVIDGELIAIRLLDGTYYSLEQVGTRAWQLLEGGQNLDSAARTIAAEFGVSVEQVAADLRHLVDELLSEGLIARRDDGAGASPGEAPLSGPVGQYVAPRLNIYRDMGNLLALDPPTPGIDDLLYRDRKRE